MSKYKSRLIGVARLPKAPTGIEGTTIPSQKSVVKEIGKFIFQLWEELLMPITVGAILLTWLYVIAGGQK